MKRFGFIVGLPVAMVLAMPLLAGEKRADVTRSVSRDGKRALEVITGETARLRLDKLEKREDARAKAAAALEERGYVPTEHVTVLRTVDLQAEAGRARAVSPVADRFVTEEGEVIFESWDDGDDATWEGMIYVENYSTGESAMFYAQIDISSSTTVSVAWEETVYTEIDATPHNGASMGRREHASPLQVASLSGTAGHPGDVSLVQWFPIHGPVDNWVGCFVTWCSRAITACKWTGPLWVECATFGCLTAFTACWNFY